MNTEIKPDFIYGLYTINNNIKKYFYVGRSIEPSRRLIEHISASKNIKNTEDKYIYIRELDSNNIEWKIEILAEITTANDYYEDWYVYKLLVDGHLLTNMKAGDSRQVANQEANLRMKSQRKIFKDAEEYITSRKQVIDEIEAEKTRRKIINKRVKVENSNSNSTSTTVFIDDLKNINKITESYAMKMIRKKKKQVAIDNLTKKLNKATEEWYQRANDIYEDLGISQMEEELKKAIEDLEK